MKEFIEKLIGRLEEREAELKNITAECKPTKEIRDKNYGYYTAMNHAKEIVNQLAEEYKTECNSIRLDNGWIPCSEDKPKKNGWYECWYMTSAVGENKYYEPITLYWEDNIWLYRPNKFTMPTQSNVVAWKPIAPYQPKGE